MTDEEIKEFKENFYKPSTSRDPNAAFIVTGFKGVKNAKDSKPEKEEEPDDKKDR
jgi:hypothetical protein